MRDVDLVGWLGRLKVVMTVASWEPSRAENSVGLKAETLANMMAASLVVQ